MRPGQGPGGGAGMAPSLGCRSPVSRREWAHVCAGGKVCAISGWECVFCPGRVLASHPLANSAPTCPHLEGGHL